MKRERRRDGIELNFDGLTDAVTNLVGTLILLVVLVVGLTREVVSQHKQPHAVAAESSTAPGQKGGHDDVREVVFRPPLEHATNKPGLFLICENNRVSIIGDNEQIARAVQQAKSQRGIAVPLPSGNFDLRLPLAGPWEVVRKPNSPGESSAELANPNSAFQRFLRAHTAAEFHIQFNVYSDSFEVFRRARRFAWRAKYEVGWNPCVAGQKVTFGEGGRNVVQ